MLHKNTAVLREHGSTSSRVVYKNKLLFSLERSKLENKANVLFSSSLIDRSKNGMAS